MDFCVYFHVCFQADYVAFQMDMIRSNQIRLESSGIQLEIYMGIHMEIRTEI